MSWLQRSVDSLTAMALLVGFVACLAIAAAGSWRAAALAVAASAAVIATGVRFSRFAAVSLLLIVALLALTRAG